MGYNVFAGVRKEADAESIKGENVPTLHALLLEVTSDDSVAEAAKTGQEGIKIVIMMVMMIIMMMVIPATAPTTTTTKPRKKRGK